MAIKISGSTIIDDSRNIVAGVAATFTGNVIVGSGVTINSTGVIATGIATAASFDGSLATTNLTGTVTNAQLAGSIADSKLNTISTAGKVDLAALEIDGGTDIGAALADADLFIVDDAAGGTNRKTAASRIKTYIADVTLTTAAQTNITSLGTLSAVTVSGDITANGNITGDGVTIISGISTVGATTFYGKLNNLTFPSANGSDGQVLTSDGAGVAQWEDASGGSVTSDAQRNTLGGTNAGDSFSGTSATDNTLFGYDAGTAFTGGDKNTAFGSYALRTQTTANGSVAIGYSAGTIVDNDGHSSTYIGYRSGSRITDGSSNTAVGYDALRTDGALYGGGSGSYLNVAIGHNAMSACGISRQNVAVGCDTLRVNAAWSNTAVGNGAGYSNTSGTRNLFAGRLSGNLNTTGSYQTILGFEAGADITEGSYNTIVGGFSGHTGTNNLTTGSNNTLIGYGVSASSATVSHEITLGNDNVTKFRIPGVNFNLKDTTATEDYVLTVDANGDCGWEAAGGSGITTANVSTSTLNVVGVSTFSNHISLDDDVELKFGAGTDGYIKSDGTNFLTQGSGTTYLRGSEVKISANGGSGGFWERVRVRADDVWLYYGEDAVRFKTTSSGSQLNGIVTLSNTTDSTSTTTGALVVNGGVGVALSMTVGGNLSVGGTLTYEDVTNVDSIGLVTARSGIEFGAAGVGGTIRANGNTTLAGIVTASGFYVGGTQVSGTTINNNANNRIITGSGTANTLEAETSLEWNATNTLTVKHDSSYQDFIVKTNAGGGELELFRCGNGPFRINNDDYSATGGGDELVVGRDSGDRGMTLASGNDSKGSIFFGDDGDGDIGKIQYDHSANAMLFTTNTSERVRIDSSGNIVFANTTTEIKTDSSDGSDNKRIILAGGGDNSQSRGAQIAIYGNEYSSHEGRLQLLAGNSGDANGVIQFYTGGSERLRIESDGDFRFSSGDAGTNYGWIRGWSSSTGDMIIGADQSATGSSGSNLIFRSRGSEKMRITSAGNVGINSDTPGDLLEIHPASNNQGLTIKDHGIVYPALTFDVNRTGTDQFLGNIRAKWNGTTVANIIFETGDDTTNKDDGVITFRTASAGSPAERMRITNAGKVGIGSVIPQTTLDVYGEVTLPVNNTLRWVLGNSLKFDMYSNSGGTLIFRNAGTERLRLNSTGELIQYGNTGSADGSADDLVLGDTTGGVNRGMTIYSNNAQNGSIAFADNDSNFKGAIQYMHNGDRFRILTGGQETLRLQSGGTDGVCTFFMGGVTNNQNKYGALTLNHYTFNTYNQIDLIKGTSTSGVNKIEIGGSDSSAGSTAATSIQFYTAANATTNNGTERMTITASGKVGINKPVPTSFLHVTGSGYETLKLENTDNGADGPYIELFNNSSSPADNDYIGIINFKGTNSNSDETNYSGIRGQSIDVTDGTEDGILTFHTRAAGSYAERLRIHQSGGILINTTTRSNNALLFINGQTTLDHTGNANQTQYPIFNDIHFTGSDTLTANRTKAAIRNDIEYSVTSGTSNSSGDRLSLYGIHNSVNTTKAAYTSVGGYNYVSNASDNASSTQTIQGVYGYGRGYGTSTGVNYNIYGGYFLGYRGGNVDNGHCYGIYARSHMTTNGSGKSGDMTGGYFECEFDEENVTNAYGVRSHMDRDAGTITNAYLFYGSYSGDGSFTNRWGIYIGDSAKNYLGGDLTITGDLNANSGTKNFRIAHPLVGLSTTKDLVHAAIEGPQVDLIYRGKVDLVDGTATVNLDTKSGMTEGTFVALNRDVQCFTTNETGWTAVKGSVTGNKITIIAQDNSCTDNISWMVVGERQDDAVKQSNNTDADGKLILEPDRRTDLNDKYQAEEEKNEYNIDPNHNPGEE